MGINLGNLKPENVICCGNFEKFLTAFDWFSVVNETGKPDKLDDMLLMPCIKVDGVKWIVQFCPSCGAEIRDVKINKTTLQKYEE